MRRTLIEYGVPGIPHIELVSRRSCLPMRADKVAKPPNSYVENIVCPFLELVYGTNPCEDKVIQR